MTDTEKELITAVLRRGKPLTDNDRNPDAAEWQDVISAFAAAQLMESCDYGTCHTYNLHYQRVPKAGSLEGEKSSGTYLSAGTRMGAPLSLYVLSAAGL